MQLKAYSNNHLFYLRTVQPSGDPTVGFGRDGVCSLENQDYGFMVYGFCNFPRLPQAN
jgi:uncharacterized protein (DUF2237 family)